MPYAAPNRPISPGHSSPSSNERTVPETAPTANSTAATCDHRRASRRATSSPRRMPRYSAISISTVNAIPNGTRMMWKPSVNAICSRAGNSCMGSLTGGWAPPSEVNLQRPPRLPTHLRVQPVGAAQVVRRRDEQPEADAGEHDVDHAAVDGVPGGVQAHRDEVHENESQERSGLPSPRGRLPESRRDQPGPRHVGGRGE